MGGDVTMDELVIVGKIVNTHGLKGEVKILPHSDFLYERFNEGNRLYILHQNQTIEVKVKSFRMHKNLPLVVFDGYDNINLIEKYKQCDILGEKNTEYLDEGEYYYSDIIGCRVIDKQRGCIGEITSIIETLAHDLLVVKTAKGEIKIPYVDAFILEVNMEEKIFYVQLIKGMYDDED